MASRTEKWTAKAPRRARPVPDRRGQAVFLSHASSDGALARRIARRLQHRGVDAWLDEDEIQLGDRLPERLRREISRVPYFLARGARVTLGEA